MFINPIDKIGAADAIGGVDSIGFGESLFQQAGQPEGNSFFKDIFQNSIADVAATEKKVAQDEYLLSTGQLDDVHTLPIDITKAQISLDLLIQLRNKALESYNTLSRLNV